MNLAEQLNFHHSPGNRFSYYPLSSRWDEVKDLIAPVAPDKRGFGLYIHIPFCREICTYCGCNIKISKKAEDHILYAQALLKEWELKTKHWPENTELLNITFGGGTPNTLNPTAQEILWQGISPLVTNKTESSLMEADPRYFTKEDAQRALELKIDRISFGVQDFNPDILSNVNRKQVREDIFKAKENLEEKQLFGIDLLWGLPKQNEETIKKWENDLKELAPDWISYYPLAKVPWLESIQQAYGDFTLPQRQEKYFLYQWGVEIFESLGYINLGMGHFIKQDRLLGNDNPIYRKVSGLFSRETPYLLGLGVSSITETPDSLSQNHKIIDRYLHSINQKYELPILKFHQKTQSEKVMNHFIEEVFTFNRIPEDMPQELKECLPIEWISPQSGEITPLGKHFKKNIMQIGEKYLFKA